MLKLDYLYCKDNPIKGTFIKDLLLIDNYQLKTLEQKENGIQGYPINRVIDKKDFKNWNPKLLDIINKQEYVWDGEVSTDRNWEI
jgi:hypothetical protein